MTTNTRRSELVRARRTQRSQTQNSSKSRRTSSLTREMPPTYTRGMDMARPATASGRRAAARKRVNVELKQLGTEIKLPAIPRAQTLLRIFSATAALVCAWGIYLLLASPIFLVGEPEITGLERLSEEEITEVLGINDSSLFVLDPQALQDTLSNGFSSLKHASVKFGLPNKVWIEVQERSPLLSWTQAGITVWVDQEGVAFETGEDSKDLIHVDAHEAPLSNQTNEEGKPQLLSTEMVTAILKLAAEAPAGTKIVYQAEHGLGWQDPRGWVVYFGPNAQDMELRLSMYEQTVQFLENKGIRPALISVEFIHQPYYRLTP